MVEGILYFSPWRPRFPRNAKTGEIYNMSMIKVALVALSVAVAASCASFSSSLDIRVGKNGYCRLNGKNVKVEKVPATLEREGVPFDTQINIKGDGATQKREIRRLLWVLTKSKYHDTKIIDTRVTKARRR